MYDLKHISQSRSHPWRNRIVDTGEKTEKDAWDTLKTMYMGADRVRIEKVQTLKAKFEIPSMKVNDFSPKISNIVSNIQALAKDMEEAYVVEKLLCIFQTNWWKFLPPFSNLQILKRWRSMRLSKNSRLMKKECMVIVIMMKENCYWLCKSGLIDQRNKEKMGISYYWLIKSGSRLGRGRGDGNSDRGGRRGGGSYQGVNPEVKIKEKSSVSIVIIMDIMSLNVPNHDEKGTTKRTLGKHTKMMKQHCCLENTTKVRYKKRFF